MQTDILISIEELSAGKGIHLNGWLLQARMAS